MVSEPSLHGSETVPHPRVAGVTRSHTIVSAPRANVFPIDPRRGVADGTAAGCGMRVRAGVLGEIEMILGDREIDIGSARRRCVLAVLLVEANRVVPVDQLVRRVWDGSPPPKATASLRGHLSRLRTALAPAPAPEACAIFRRSGGYVLTMDESAVDIHLFRRLLRQARTAGNDQAAELFEEALRLWR